MGGPHITWPGEQGFTFDDAAVWGPFLAVVFAVIAAWIAMSALTGWLAGRKNRDSGLWFVLGFFTGPIALLAISLMKALPKTD